MKTDATIFRQLTTLCIVFSSSVAFSQPQQTPSPWRFSIDGGVAHQSSSEVENTSSEFSRDRAFISAGVDYGWSRRDSIGISVGAGSSDYKFSDQNSPDSFEAWDKIEESQISITGRFGISDTGSLIIIPSFRQYGESGASSSDSQTYGLLTAAFWRVSETLTIGPGVGVFSRLEDSTSVFPILAIDWDISDRWNLSTGGGLAATRGPGLTLGYQLNPAWSLELSGRYEEFEFRLNDEGIAPGGVGSDRSIPVAFSARYKPRGKFSFSAFLGTGLDGRLRLRDASGYTLEDRDYDSGMLVGATFSFQK